MHQRLRHRRIRRYRSWYTLTALSPLPPGFAGTWTAPGATGPYAVTGIATTPGVHTFTVRAQDAAGNIGVRTFTLTVASFTVPTPELPDAAVGVFLFGDGAPAGRSAVDVVVHWSTAVRSAHFGRRCHQRDAGGGGNLHALTPGKRWHVGDRRCGRRCESRTPPLRAIESCRSPSSAPRSRTRSPQREAARRKTGSRRVLPDGLRLSPSGSDRRNATRVGDLQPRCVGERRRAAGVRQVCVVRAPPKRRSYSTSRRRVRFRRSSPAATAGSNSMREAACRRINGRWRPAPPRHWAVR